MSVRFAEPGEVKPCVHKDPRACLFPWVAEIPFIPTNGNGRILVAVEVFPLWSSAITAALSMYPDHRPQEVTQ